MDLPERIRLIEDAGRGIGASHQTGWTALVIRCLGKT